MIIQADMIGYLTQNKFEFCLAKNIDFKVMS